MQDKNYNAYIRSPLACLMPHIATSCSSFDSRTLSLPSPEADEATDSGRGDIRGELSNLGDERGDVALPVVVVAAGEVKSSLICGAGCELLLLRLKKDGAAKAKELKVDDVLAAGEVIGEVVDAEVGGKVPDAAEGGRDVSETTEARDASDATEAGLLPDATDAGGECAETGIGAGADVTSGGGDLAAKNWLRFEERNEPKEVAMEAAFA